MPVYGRIGQIHNKAYNYFEDTLSVLEGTPFICGPYLYSFTESYVWLESSRSNHDPKIFYAYVIEPDDYSMVGLNTYHLVISLEDYPDVPPLTKELDIDIACPETNPIVEVVLAMPETSLTHDISLPNDTEIPLDFIILTPDATKCNYTALANHLHLLPSYRSLYG